MLLFVAEKAPGGHDFLYLKVEMSAASASRNYTRNNRFLHPNNLLAKAQRIIAGDATKAVPLKDFFPGMNVTIVLHEDDRVVRGRVKRRDVDRIYIETDGLTEVYKKHEIKTILGRSVRGGKRRHTQRRTRRRTHRH